jgi:hypothetical protein
MTDFGQSQWLRYPRAEAFFFERLDQLVSKMPPLARLQRQMEFETNTRLFDWLDHMVIAEDDSVRDQLGELGFEQEDVPVPVGDTVYYHPGAIFPRIVLRDAAAESGTVLAVAIHVEAISEFLLVHRKSVPIEGTPLAPYRRARVWSHAGREVLVVERRGHAGFLPVEKAADYAQRYLYAYEQWATRPRRSEDSLTGMHKTLTLARSLVQDLGVDAAAWVAFAVERAYWQRRNRAGQVQRLRQDKLGLGWANHDHHTFRSSRAAFKTLIEILETFGFRPRERFYAGAEAGWGAQVMEQPVCRIAVFADVDLSPEEVTGDFAHLPLEPRQEFGTVGMWTALHGESMLSAGLHHLAARFDFEGVRAGLAEWDVGMMKPFSEFSYLQQAFTRGERWDVDPGQLKRLIVAGRIDANLREQFLERGAVGSHLEDIQRAEGFKGFNQQAVSDIISRTDPRIGLGGG